jgi:P-type E1-E2 ATPase
MIEIDIPGFKKLFIRHLILDVNGTIAVDGFLLEGVAERLHALAVNLEIILLTANTYGRQNEIEKALNLRSVCIAPGKEAKQKAEFVERIGVDGTVAIGNGANDYLMLEKAAIGIAIIGEEGATPVSLTHAEVVCRDINNALDLLLHPKRLIATLRR